MSFYRLSLKIIIILIIISISINPAFAADRQEAEKFTIKGMKALKENKLVPAKKFLTQAIQEDPTFDKAHEALGDYYSLEGSQDEAVREYDKAINLGGDSVSLTYKIAKSRYTAQEFDKAVIHLEKLKKAYQDDPEFYFLMGESYRRLNNFKRAEVNLERVVFQNKKSLKAHLSLGRLYYDNKYWQKAKEHFTIVKNHSDADDETKEEIKKLILEIDNQKQEGKLWHIAIPVVVLMIIFPSYAILKKHKKEHPETLEEEFDG